MCILFLLIIILLITAIFWIFMKKSIKYIFIRLLSVCTIGSFGASLASDYKDPIKCVSLKNQPCQTIPTLVNLKSDETIFDPFAVSVIKCCRSCNTIDDPYGSVGFQIKFENYEYKRMYWG